MKLSEYRTSITDDVINSVIERCLRYCRLVDHNFIHFAILMWGADVKDGVHTTENGEILPCEEYWPTIIKQHNIINIALMSDIDVDIKLPSLTINVMGYNIICNSCNHTFSKMDINQGLDGDKIISLDMLDKAIMGGYVLICPSCEEVHIFDESDITNY